MGNLEFDYKWVAEKLGIPTLFCLILFWAIYQAGSYTANKVVDPIVTAHTAFLSAEKQHMELISSAVTKQANNMERQSYQMEQHTQLLQRISQNSEVIKNDQKKFPAIAGTSNN